MGKKSTWKHKAAAVLISCFMIFVVLLLGEVYCRLFTRIDFLENSKELFTPNRYGRSWGNTPNLDGIASGKRFHIDADGFRADPHSGSTAPANAPAILIVGDSVTFGVGLNDDETVTEHLRRRIPDRRFYNASVIGYFTFDYKNVVDSLIKQKPEIKTVALFFCLNDINDISALQIKLQANSDVIPEPEPDKNSIPQKINKYLRTRSKLYLLIKKMLQDTQLTHFQADADFYRDDENVKFGMQYIADIKKTLDEAGVRLKVFLLPYEAQLRPGSPEDFLMPQRKVSDFLRSNNIDFYDATDDFKNAGPSERLYLFDDPMHLSAEGHAVLANVVCRNLGENCAMIQ
jgi:lysophospholipase L1-like esterase